MKEADREKTEAPGLGASIADDATPENAIPENPTMDRFLYCLKPSFARTGAVLTLLLLSVSIYLNSLSNGFVRDDVALIQGNPWIGEITHFPDFFLTSAYGFQDIGLNYYRPMMFVLFSVVYWLLGPGPWGFHLFAVLLHAATTITVFYVVGLLLQKQANAAEAGFEESGFAQTHALKLPFFAALLFAAHPIHTEAVNYVAATQDVTFSLFYLLSFYFYIKSDGNRGGPLALSVLFFLLSCFSKEPGLTLLLLLVAYDYTFQRGLGLRSMRRYAPYAIAGALYLALRTYSLHGFAPASGPEGTGAELNLEYLVNIPFLFALYLGKLLVPINLNAFYDLSPLTSGLAWRITVASVGAAGFALALYLLRHNRLAFLGLLWILIPLLPVFHIQALGNHIFAERYLYQPSVGFVIVLTVGGVGVMQYLASRTFRGPGGARGGRGGPGGVGGGTSVALAAVLVVTALYCVGVVKRNPVWRSNLTLWQDTAEKSPKSAMARYNLGNAFYRRDQTDEAIGEFTEAVRLAPGYASARNNLGLAYLKKGLLPDAIDELSVAVRLSPGSPNYQANLGNAYLAQGQAGEAIGAFERALDIRPDSPETLNALQSVYERLGPVDELIGKLKAALELEPGNAGARLALGDAYEGAGRTHEAIAQYRLSLELNPKSPRARNRLGVAYGKRGMLDKAMAQFKEALALSPDYASARYNLGFAYMQKGLNVEAAREFKATLRIDPDHAGARRELDAIHEKTTP